jgi:hypothetical protein
MADSLADQILAMDGPEHWLTGQLEFIDSQLANHVRTRARHMVDVATYTRLGAQLPLRYHQAQADHCTTRIQELLDLRLQVMHKGAQQ